ncbi:MAG: dUTP diphosphatase [Magnetospirillum sp. WYHS-4]
MKTLSVAVTRLAHAQDLPLPSHATPLSAGVDLLAAVPQAVLLEPRVRAVIPTGIAIALPEGYEAQVRSRSGLAAKHGVAVLNSPGTIDADYRGEIGVILVNHGKVPFRVERGMRIAQLVVAPVLSIQWAESESLPETERGTGGFGSTGVQTTGD